MTFGNNTIGYTPQNSTEIEMDDTVLLEPYWTDMDTTNLDDSSIYYTVYDKLQPTTNITRKWRPFLDPSFDPTWAVEISWNYVSPFPSNKYGSSQVSVSFLVVSFPCYNQIVHNPRPA